MSCRQAFEIDLAGFLEDPGAAAFAAFRDHYPRCAACAAELRAWTELHLQLDAERPGGDHPEPDLLARYEGDPDTLGPAERRTVEHHLAACGPCREELRALAAFEPEWLGAGAGIAARLEEPSRTGALGLVGPALRRLLWHPAFAYAALAIALGPAIYQMVGPANDLPRPRARTKVEQRQGTAAKRETGRSDPGPGLLDERSARGFVAEVGEEARPRLAASPPPAVNPLEPLPSEPRAASVRRHVDVAQPTKGRRAPARASAPEAEAERAPGPRASAAEASAVRAPKTAPATDWPSEAEADAGMQLEGAEVEKDAAGSASGFGSVAELTRAAHAVWLDPAAPQTVIAGPNAAILLRTTLPPALLSASEVEIHVASASGQRELIERHPPRDPLEIRIPSGWLEPGEYRVTVALRGRPPNARYRLTVRRP